MIAGVDFIVISDDWGRHPFSCQHIMEHFLPANRVLWVQTVGMRRPRLSVSDVKRSIGKLRSFVMTDVPGSSPRNLTVVSPPMLPLYNRMVRSMNRRSVVSRVQRKSKECGFISPVLLTTLPNASEYLGLLGERLSIYYCVDDFTHWPGVNGALAGSMEKRLLGRVDLVVAVSDALRSSRRPANGSEVRLLTHGVDAEHFGRAGVRTSDPAVLSALQGVPGSIVGFFGLLDERLDQDILEEILLSHPEWSVVLIGKSLVSLQRLAKYQNFVHVDAVTYEDLPGYASLFSVCILPYVRSQLADSINPLKLKEYLATGKPVVATALPEAVKLVPWVNIAASPREFVRGIEHALAEPNASTASLQRMLLQESWAGKAELLSGWIEEELGKKGFRGQG